MRVARVFLVFLAAGILALAAPTSSGAQTPSALLIRGATIIDGLSDAPLRDRSLLIEGNSIRELLPADAGNAAGFSVSANGLVAYRTGGSEPHAARLI